MIKKNPTILLTFDAEEFDIPLEYNEQIGIDKQLLISGTGMNAIQQVIDSKNISCTFFTTAFFAMHNVEMIKNLSIKHEIASHSFYHSIFKPEDLLLSKIKLEEITGKKITGFRMPRMKSVNDRELAAAGYLYSSSINPTLLPGRYNHLDKPRTVFKNEFITQVPASVSPHLRIPLFWLFFKNAPLWMIKKISAQVLRKDGYLNLYFHPWEFADISQFRLPGWMKKPCDSELTEKFIRYISFLKELGEFRTINDFLFD